ncbi:MAG: glycosyltransferase [Chloroflexi bacterium]|nr:glycosyltransferase [Chloroflexota bacterium]
MDTPLPTLPRRLRYLIEALLVNTLILSTLYQLIVYLANRRFWSRTLPPVDTPPSVSVVVPLRSKNLDTLALLHLLAVTAPSDAYELLLVLEDEHDPAWDIAQEVTRSYPDVARVVFSGSAAGHNGKIHNLNAGYQVASGDLVAFVDADVQTSAELWNAALAVMDDAGVGAAFAPPLVPDFAPAETAWLTGGEMLAGLYTNHIRAAGLPLAALTNHVTELQGGFMLFRHHVLEEAGGFLHLLDSAADDISLGQLVRENGYRIAVIPVPVHMVPEEQMFDEVTARILRKMIIAHAYFPLRFLASPFTNPLIAGLSLGLITESEGRWWGRRLWWGLVGLRMTLAYDLDRTRFGRGWSWIAYAQLFMLDTFIVPALWLRALFRRSFVWRGRTYRIHAGGRVVLPE